MSGRNSKYNTAINSMNFGVRLGMTLQHRVRSDLLLNHSPSLMVILSPVNGTRLTFVNTNQVTYEWQNWLFALQIPQAVLPL